MVFLLLFAAAVIWVTGMVVLLVHLRRAPEGVEDASGFRVVVEARKPDMVMVPAINAG